MTVYLLNTLNFLNLIRLVVAETTRMWKSKRDVQLLVGSLPSFVQYRFSFNWCVGSLVKINTVTVLFLSALQQLLVSVSKQNPAGALIYWILLLLSVALPLLPYLAVMLPNA